MNREQYEKAALSNHTEWEELDFIKFIEKPAYDGTEPIVDTFYDGSLYYFSESIPIIGKHSNLEFRILGPFWNVIFKIELLGINNLSFSANDMSSFGDIYSSTVDHCSNNQYSFELIDFHQQTIIRCDFSEAKLHKAILLKAIER